MVFVEVKKKRPSLIFPSGGEFIILSPRVAPFVQLD